MADPAAGAPAAAAAAPAAAVDDAPTLASLRKRVVDSGGPPEASLPVAREWIRFAEARTPAWALGPNGKLSLAASASASRADAYAGFFKPVFVDSRIRLECRLCVIVVAPPRVPS